MRSRRYTDEYRAEAVKQVLEKGHPTTEVAQRLGINKHSLYDWVQRAKRGPAAATLSFGSLLASAVARRGDRVLLLDVAGRVAFTPV